MTKLIYAASAAALMTMAGAMPSLAQSSTSGASSAMTPMVTCRDLSTMDRETARNVAFYYSGFQAAAGSSMASSSGTSGGSSTSGTSTSADAGTSGSSGSSTTDTTGSTTAAGSSGTTSSGSSGASSTMTAQLPGFSNVDIDKIMAACQSSPDKQLSEVMGSASTAQ